MTTMNGVGGGYCNSIFSAAFLKIIIELKTSPGLKIKLIKLVVFHTTVLAQLITIIIIVQRLSQKINKIRVLYLRIILVQQS